MKHKTVDKYKKREYDKEYNQRPSVKHKQRERRQMLLNKQKRKENYENNKEMVLKQRKEYYQKNKEEIKERKKGYHKKNKKKDNKRCREYQKNNKEKLREQNKGYNTRPEIKKRKKEYDIKYNKENKDRIKKQQKKYQENNRENINKHQIEYLKKKYRGDLIFKMKNRLRRLLRGSLIQYSKTGKIMSSKEYGINYKEIIESLKPFPKDIENYHIDHIIPLSWFNFNDPKEIKWAFAPENHQWLTIEENTKKGNRYILIR